ncbi:MAG: VWA domain-containing protein [Spirochaetales bacterium]|nr:VWA domain-containing protein [Spirochaetales bacterium]
MILCLCFLLFSGLYAYAAARDIIVLVDTSISMESCFNDVIVYVMSNLLATEVHNNDTIHLLQFSTIPVHELSVKVENEGSLASLMKEIMFLREKALFGRYTDIVSALEGLHTYTAGLSPDQQKQLFIISDMQHDPPLSSPHANRDPELVKYALSRNTHLVSHHNGWYVLSILIKGKPDLSLSTPDPLDELIHDLGIGNKDFQPETSYDSYLLKSEFPFPIQEGVNRETRIPPAKNREIRNLNRILPVIYGVFIIVLIFLCVTIIILKKKLEGSFKDVFDTKKWQENIVSFFSDDLPLIEMRVSFQNPHIGFRNIHKLKDNKSLSIGGGLSPFLIFLIPMPQHIAEIYMEKGKYIFNPVLKEYFPDVKKPIFDCLNKEIPVVSKHGYRSMIVFREYVPPLLTLHTVLHSIQYDTENPKDVLHTHKLALSAIVS